ncbi:hypothetical protein F4804DRAFT_350304 [Jackrogersella minutella]|nr:hypothetical protein F4804DRAFT_350304 [Jackrogersella minutella]
MAGPRPNPNSNPNHNLNITQSASGKPQSTFSHFNGRVVTMDDPYGDNLLSGTSISPSTQDSTSISIRASANNASSPDLPESPESPNSLEPEPEAEPEPLSSSPVRLQFPLIEHSQTNLTNARGTTDTDKGKNVGIPITFTDESEESDSPSPEPETPRVTMRHVIRRKPAFEPQGSQHPEGAAAEIANESRLTDLARVTPWQEQQRQGDSRRPDARGPWDKTVAGLKGAREKYILRENSKKKNSGSSGPEGHEGMCRKLAIRGWKKIKSLFGSSEGEDNEVIEMTELTNPTDRSKGKQRETAVALPQPRLAMEVRRGSVPSDGPEWRWGSDAVQGLHWASEDRRHTAVSTLPIQGGTCSYQTGETSADGARIQRQARREAMHEEPKRPESAPKTPPSGSD